MSTIAANLQAVRQRIESACSAAGRPSGSVRLVAAAKTVAPAAIREAAAAGQRDFGENYVQEGEEKMLALADLALTWHYIGPIQSNKTRSIAEHFDWVHTIDRGKVAGRLSAARAAHLPELQVCIQVNVSGEASKNGIAPEEVAPLAKQVAALPRLRLRGLMAIPEPTPDTALARRRFAQLRKLRDALNHEGFALDTLSMGMSADLEAAIAEGATLVRVGTAIFGRRPN
ncbi:MAG: YggS family pyridoxal phosphate-dependent enzyme [Burkholderiales bacterium]